MKSFSDILFGKAKEKEKEKQFLCRLNNIGVYTWGKHLSQLSDSEKIAIANFLIADIPNVIITKR